jgi:hypothetical protein
LAHLESSDRRHAPVKSVCGRSRFTGFAQNRPKAFRKGFPALGRVNIAKSLEQDIGICDAVIRQELAETEEQGNISDMRTEFVGPRGVFGEKGREAFQRAIGIGRL